MNFIEELKRRNVFKVAIMYLVVAWLMVQLATTLAPALLLPEWTVRLVTTLLLIGFPIALIFAWAFEMTPDGFKKTKDVEPEVSVTSSTGQKINFMIMAVMALALSWFMFDKFGPSNNLEPQYEIEASVAVLPFVSMSSGEDDGYFADGLTEELLNSLAQLSNLKVAGRTSSFYYKGKEVPIPEIGKTLGVAHVLEGSVRRSGDQLRITAQLIEAEGGFHLWSDTFDRTINDIFAIQEEIAEEVTKALRVSLLGEEVEAIASHGTSNTEAQTLYLIAKARLRLGNNPMVSGGIGVGTEHLRSARRLLEQVVDLDPNFAEGWVELAKAYLLVAVNILDDSGEGLLRNEANRLAMIAAEKALTLKPKLPEAQLAKGLYFLSKVFIDRNPSTLEDMNKVFETALENNPNHVGLLEAFAVSQSFIENQTKAISLYDRAIELDPLSQIGINRADAIYASGDISGARAELIRIGKIYPTGPWKVRMALMEFYLGHFHHSLLWDQNALVQTPFIWASFGETDKAIERLNLIGQAGGTVATTMETVSLLVKRDYEAARVFVEQNDGAVVGEERFNFLLRNWDAANKSMETYFAENPSQRENVLGKGPARNRLSTNFGRPVQAIHSASLAYLYEKLGEKEKAAPIWDWALEVLEGADVSVPPVSYEVQQIRALIAAGRGQKEEALKGYEELFNMGWRHRMGVASSSYGGIYEGSLGWFEDSPLLDSIRDEPRFIAVVEKVKAANEAMRQELEDGLTLEDIMDEK